RTLDDVGRELTPVQGPFREVRGPAREWSRLVLLGEVVVDREHSRFAWRTSADEAGVQVLHVCHVGAESAVTLECHARQDQFASALPSFSQLSDSAAFDAARAHKEPEKAVAWWLPLAVFLGVSVAIFVPVAYFWKRRSPRRPERRREDVPVAPLAEEEIPVAPLAEEEASPPTAFSPSTGIVAELPALSQTPLPNKAPPAAGRGRGGPAEAPSTCVGERTYGVYVLRDEVYFIDDGPGDLPESRKLVARAIRDERPRADAGRLGERPTADDLFAMVDGEVNFRVKSQDVWQAAIEAPGYWDSGDGVVGTLRFGHRSWGERTLRFRGTTDMRGAIELLGGAWGHCLSVNATWDRGKKAFVRQT